MPLDISIKLSDEDIDYFRRIMEEAQQRATKADEAAIIESAGALLDRVDQSSASSFVIRKLKELRALVDMVNDEEWPLGEQERLDIISALAYFYSEDDVISDDVPALGLLDDAIVVELLTRELESEIAAYEEFCRVKAFYEQLEGHSMSREALLKENQHLLFTQMRERMQRHRRTDQGVGRLTRFSLT